MHYYRFHITDFRSGSSNMSQLERWLYRDLLDVIYDTEAPLPAETSKIFRLVGARNQEQKDAIMAILQDKFTLTENGYINARAESEINAFQIKADSARKANQIRWGSEIRPKSDLKSDARSDLNPDLKSDLKSAPNQEPIKEIHIRTKKPKQPTTILVEVKDLVAEGIDEQDAKDWFQARRAKNAKTLTPRAWENFKRVAVEYGGSPQAAVKLCADKGWIGIDHDGGKKAFAANDHNAYEDFAGPNCAN